MVRLSSELTGQETQKLRDARQVEFKNQFNGIWACASLIHVDEGSTEGVLSNLGKALKTDGCLYASYINMEMAPKQKGIDYLIIMMKVHSKRLSMR